MVLTRQQKLKEKEIEEELQRKRLEKDRKAREESEENIRKLEKLKTKYSAKMGSTDPIFNGVDSFWSEINDSVKLDALITGLGTLEGTKFDFNGFNPDRLLQKLIDCAKAKRRTRQEFFKDIIDMILIGLCRGNIREDQIDRTVEGGGAVTIRGLITDYKIKKRHDATDRTVANVEDLTFTRMVSLLPHLASLLLHSSNTLARTMVISAFGSDKLPKCMLHSGFAGLIPEGINFLTNVFSLAHTAYMIDFSMMINPNARSKTIEEIYLVQSRFCKISVANSKYTPDMRVKYLIKLGLNDTAAFELILAVANALYTKVNKKSMNLTRIRAACLKNNLIAYRSDDTVLANLTLEAATVKNIDIQGVSSVAQPPTVTAENVTEDADDVLF